MLTERVALTDEFRLDPDIDIALAILSGENVRTEIIKSEFAVGKHEEKIISQVQVPLLFDWLSWSSLTASFRHCMIDRLTPSSTNTPGLSIGYSRRSID